MAAKFKHYLDLSELVNAGKESLSAAGMLALEKTRRQFDDYARGRYTRSGLGVFGASVRMVTRPRSVIYILRASRKKRMPWSFEVAPGIGRNTTGRDREQVAFSIERSLRFLVSDGFIWNRRIYVRVPASEPGRIRRSGGTYGGGHITLLRGQTRGMSASAAEALAGCYANLTLFLADEITKSMREALK